MSCSILLSLAFSPVLGTKLEVNTQLVNKQIVKISDSGDREGQIQILTLSLIS